MISMWQVDLVYTFQSPRGDFGFLKRVLDLPNQNRFDSNSFQSPRGDFGFLKIKIRKLVERPFVTHFNPLAGILVF